MVPKTIDAEFGLLVDLPKTIGVIATVNSTNMSVAASELTDSQMNEATSDALRDLKRRLEEMEKENRLLKHLSEKRQRRATKKAEKGQYIKPLVVIKLQDRISESSMYVVGKSIRTTIFRNTKYFTEDYKDGALQHAFRILNYREENDKKKYTDYVLYYIDKKIAEHRNNAIHKLKRVVLGLDGGKSRQMNVASIRRYTSLTEVNVVCWV